MSKLWPREMHIEMWLPRKEGRVYASQDDGDVDSREEDVLLAVDQLRQRI